MTIAADLLAACVAAPDDDLPRAVWADAVGGERGELVAVQLRLARGEGTAAQVGALLRRERELLAAHGGAWSGLAGEPGVTQVSYARGFVATIEVDAAALAARGAAIAAAAPLAHGLGIGGLHAVASPDATGALVGGALAAWGGRRLTALQLGTPSWRVSRGGPTLQASMAYPAAAVAELVARGTLGGLTSLTLREADAAVDVLLRSGQLAQLERLRIAVRDPGAAEALVRASPALRAFALIGGAAPPGLAARLPAAVRELTLPLDTAGSLDLDPGLRELPAAPIAATLEALHVRAGRLRLDAAAVARLPRLRTLDLDGVLLWDDAQRSLLARALPALRALRITDHGRGGRSPAAFHLALAQRFGAQLEQLVISTSRADGPPPLEPLRPLVAGDVLTVPAGAPWPGTVSLMSPPGANDPP